MEYLSNFQFKEIHGKALERLESNPNIWANRNRKVKKKVNITGNKQVKDRVTGLTKIVNTDDYFKGLDTRFKPKNNLVRNLGIAGGAGALGYLGYKGYQRVKKKNPDGLQIGDETDRKVLSTIGKGTKWAAGATASGKALDYGRRGLLHHYSNWKMKKPNLLTEAQKNSYSSILKDKGMLGELGRNYNFVSGIGNIGEKAGKVLSTKWGKGLAVGGVGALGAGLYGYKKAKDYYLI